MRSNSARIIYKSRCGGWKCGRWTSQLSACITWGSKTAILSVIIRNNMLLLRDAMLNCFVEVLFKRTSRMKESAILERVVWLLCTSRECSSIKKNEQTRNQNKAKMANSTLWGPGMSLLGHLLPLGKCSCFVTLERHTLHSLLSLENAFCWMGKYKCLFKPTHLQINK